jgi:hypothetical protein
MESMMKRVTITHSKTGQQAECWDKTIKTLSQEGIDNLVFAAHSPSPINVAMRRALALEAV